MTATTSQLVNRRLQDGTSDLSGLLRTAGNMVEAEFTYTSTSTQASPGVKT